MRQFAGHVTGCTQTKDGYEITLDATAFYPEGGGQPADHGTLDGINVLDVQEKDGNVVHFCDGPLEVGETVTGTLDWERRFDLMQQHSGEHMVSGVVFQKYGYHNVGFHMGAQYITIDFDGVIPQEDLQEIEDTVNRFIWQNIPLKCWVPSPEELPHVSYRRKRDLPWPVRIVEIPGVDSCACCGVQVASTGEIGLVKLFSMMKFREGVRIEMAAGGRALAILGEAFRQNRLVSQAFSSKLMETGEAAQKMNAALEEEKFRAVGLKKQLFREIAQSYAGKENPVCIRENLPPDQVRELADAIAAVCTGGATVLSGTDGEGYSICVVSRDTDVRPMGKAAAQALHGRGGGKPEAFQGKLLTTLKEIRQYYRIEL